MLNRTFILLFLLMAIAAACTCENWVSYEAVAASVTGPDSVRIGEQIPLNAIVYLRSANSEFSHYSIEQVSLDLFVTLWAKEDQSKDGAAVIEEVPVVVEYKPSVSGFYNFHFNHNAKDTSIHIFKGVLVY